MKFFKLSFDGARIVAHDLGPASDARICFESKSIVPEFLIKHVSHLRTDRSRADNAHFTFQHIDKLGNLVYTRLPKDPADFCCARVKGRSFKPSRSCLKNSGPLDVSFMAIAARSMIGAARTKPTDAKSPLHQLTGIPQTSAVRRCRFH